MKKKFQNGDIDKHQYMQEIFQYHKNLFDYPQFLIDSPIQKIEISKEKVLFHIEDKGDLIKLYCDGRDAYSLPLIYMNLLETESNERRIINELINHDDVVFDIGANIGWYSISLMLKKKDISVFSFEPIPSSYQLLKENLEINKLNTSNIFNFGLSDENKKVKFFFDVEYAMASSMADLRGSVKTEFVECDTKRLDDFVNSTPNLNRLDFIKCDVEGAELLVFKGGLKTIEKYKPIVLFEMLRKWSAKFNYHPNDIINLFKELDYECFAIGNKAIRKLTYVDEETVETNYLCLEKNKHKELINNLS
ncbi:MAG: FkbM family methyltransferase [Legionellaceae bacterium]|nr:FkbM family methyltransferase [Legionellaceae bacterium]